MSEVLNAVYDPTVEGSLRAVCFRASEAGLGLSHVVPVADREWVAVFTRPGDGGDVYTIINGAGEFVTTVPQQEAADDLMGHPE